MVICPYCRDDLTTLDNPSPVTACANCGATHHTECWQECGRCASCKFRSVGTPRLPTSITLIVPTFSNQMWALCYDLPLALTWDMLLVSQDLLIAAVQTGIETIWLLRDSVCSVSRRTLKFLLSSRNEPVG